MRIHNKKQQYFSYGKDENGDLVINLIDYTSLKGEPFKRLSHTISSPEIEYELINTDMGNESILNNAKTKGRKISVEFVYEVDNMEEYDKMRDRVYEIFMSNEPYHISFEREPNKLWYVVPNGEITIPPNNKIGSFTINFTCLTDKSRAHSKTKLTTKEPQPSDLIKTPNTIHLVKYHDSYDGNTMDTFIIQESFNYEVSTYDKDFRIILRGDINKYNTNGLIGIGIYSLRTVNDFTNTPMGLTYTDMPNGAENRYLFTHEYFTTPEFMNKATLTFDIEELNNYMHLDIKNKGIVINNGEIYSQRANGFSGTHNLLKTSNKNYQSIEKGENRIVVYNLENIELEIEYYKKG